MKLIKKVLKKIKEKGYYPEIKVVNGISSEPIINIEGKEVLLFCSANYLGFANDPEIKKAVIDGINKYGLHPVGATLISGTLDIHRKLERRMAEFKGTEDAIEVV